VKALTIHQPAASLIVTGQKKIETRTWRTLYRGPLAIHASGKLPHKLSLGQLAALGEVGLDPDELATGALVGTARLVECREAGELAKSASLGDLERALGDFGPDRYGWLLREPVALAEPVPMLGARNLWEVDDGVLAA